MKRNIGSELAARMTHLNEMLANGESVEAISRADVDRPQPVAWGVIERGEFYPLALFTYRTDAEQHADRKNDIGLRNCEAIPLYATPPTHAKPGEGCVHGGCTLTAGERLAVERLCNRAKWSNAADDLDAADAETVVAFIKRLDGLLERLG